MKNVTMIILITTLAFSCAKKRDDEIVQGQKEGLLQVSDYQGVTHSVTTKDAINNGSLDSNAVVTQISSEVKNQEAVTQVSYSSSSDLMVDAKLFARANSSLKVSYELNDKYLIINKIADKKDVPFHETTYSKKIDENTFQVPLMGYPVTLFKLEHTLDSNGEKTNQLQTIQVQALAQATHFKIDRLGKIDFELTP